MSYEGRLYDLVSPIFGGHFYPDTFPDDFRPNAPACVYQQVGGTDQWYVDQTLPEYQNARLQFYVWGEERDAVNAACDQLRAALANSINVYNGDIIFEPLGARVSDYNDILKLRGARQDFGIWYKPPTP